MDWLRSDFEIKLVTPGKGDGPSTTRFVYLRAGTLSVYSAFLATVACVVVYLMDGHKADALFLGFAAGLWVNTLAFASKVKTNQANNAKEITNAQTTPPGATS